MIVNKKLMKDTIVSFKVAKLAREKGLKPDLMEISYYKPSGEMADIFDIAYNKDHRDFFIYAPTQSLLQKWLRENHNMDVIPCLNKYKRGKRYCFPKGGCDIVMFEYNKLLGTVYRYFNKYEEALEQGLYEALKLIEND